MAYLIFQEGRIAPLILLIVFTIMFLVGISKAKKKLPFIRRIAALEAIEEGVGRAAEMGRPLMWIPGAAGTSFIGGGTSAAGKMASISILAYAARLAAERGVRVICGTAWPDDKPIIEDVLLTEYKAAGKPELFRPEDVRFAPGWFPYVTHAMGWLAREKPATSLIVGAFGHESLTISEASFNAGAFGIGGSNSIYQLPWIISCNDYSFIGTEMFVAGAYIARDPDQLGTVSATDWLTWILIAIIVIGMVVITAGSKAVVDALSI